MLIYRYMRRILFLFLLINIWFVSFNFTLAQKTNTSSPIPLTYTLIEPVNLDDPTVKITGSSTLNIDSANFSSYINKVYIFILVIVAVISVFMIMRGGIMYLTTDIVTDLKKGREIVVGVLSGLIFIFCIYLIFWLVNPQLLNSNFVFKGLESVTGSIGGGSNNKGIIFIEKCPEGVAIVQSKEVCRSIADNLTRMIEKAKEEGVILSISSAYRSPDYQKELIACWDSGIYCQKEKGLVFRPGENSNHQSGLAVDFNNAKPGGNVHNWLTKNATTYGFKNELPNDPVHWSPSGK